MSEMDEQSVSRAWRELQAILDAEPVRRLAAPDPSLVPDDDMAEARRTLTELRSKIQSASSHS